MTRALAAAFRAVQKNVLRAPETRHDLNCFRQQRCPEESAERWRRTAFVGE